MSTSGDDPGILGSDPAPEGGRVDPGRGTGVPTGDGDAVPEGGGR